MQIHDPLPVDLAGLKDVNIHNHGFLPIAASYCRRLGLVELVNSMISTQMELKPGLVVQAMVLDVLSGRNPLYHVEDFLAQQDIQLLLGEQVDAHAFNDTNLARSLDAMFECGTSKIVTELGLRAASTFQLDLGTASYDTTSTNVWGEYRACEGEETPEGPVITYGYSKDHQPQLKQFMTELLCVDRGVPIFGRTLDGNSSDKDSNHEMLTRISSIMARHGLGPGAFVYVADSAMVTGPNLKALGSNSFITRLPGTYAACKNAIAEAVDVGNWVTIGSLTEHPAVKSRPEAQYKVHESTVDLYGIPYRAVVVHSDSHDKRRQKKLEKRIACSADAIAKTLKHVQKVYFCEADARKASSQAEKLSDSLHRVSVTIEPVEVRQRGRPSMNNPATDTRYQLSWQLIEETEGIQRERDLAGCFVMITNVPAAGEVSLDSAGVLRTYKGQYSIESDFAFLKDPLVVNDLFLKTPSRIDALGMILIIALMVWRIMERSMRLYLEQTQTTVPGWDNKPTDKPTSYMLTRVFFGIQVMLFKDQRFFIKEPIDRQSAFLSALGLDSQVFRDPSCQCKPIIPKNIGTKG
jgi:transposase